MNLRFINRLQFKVALASLAVSILPLAILGISSVRTAERVIESIVTNQLDGVAAEKQELLQRWIAERKADLEVVAGSSVARSFDTASIGPYLRLVEEQYKVYSRFVIVRADGRTVYDSKAEADGSWTGAAWFRHTGGGQPYMSEVGLEEGGRQSVFHLAAPIRSREGRIEGAVCATVRTEAILGRVLKVSLGETGESYLVDKTGTFLAHKDPRRTFKDTIAQSGSFDQIFQPSPSQPVYTDYRGIAVLGASRAVAGTEWYVVVEQDRDEAFAPSERLKHNIYIVIVLTLLAAMILSALLAYYVSAPIRRLGEAANALAHGDFDNALLTARTARHDEIGGLYGDFQHMAGQLRQRHEMLQKRVGDTEAELRKADVKLKSTLEAAARSEHLAALGRLASGVAHEIRTPLTSLKLYLQSVQDDLTISPDHSEDFALAMQQVGRIEGTINHFLNFARPCEPVLTRIDLPGLVADALSIVRPRATHQGVQVDVQATAGLPRVEGDVRQLGEALVNVLVNALEEMPDGGRLAISVRSGSGPSGHGDRSGTWIEVADTGPGIKPAHLEHLFEPFFTTKASGSGLGLAIAHGTIQRHGGVLRVRSQPGAGATFSFFLPAVDDERTGVDGQNPDR